MLGRELPSFRSSRDAVEFLSGLGLTPPGPAAQTHE